MNYARALNVSPIDFMLTPKAIQDEAVQQANEFQAVLSAIFLYFTYKVLAILSCGLHLRRSSHFFTTNSLITIHCFSSSVFSNQVGWSGQNKIKMLLEGSVKFYGICYAVFKLAVIDQAWHQIGHSASLSTIVPSPNCQNQLILCNTRHIATYFFVWRKFFILLIKSGGAACIASTGF